MCWQIQADLNCNFASCQKIGSYEIHACQFISHEFKSLGQIMLPKFWEREIGENGNLFAFLAFFNRNKNTDSERNAQYSLSTVCVYRTIFV
jgi:hypothetical protein